MKTKLLFILTSVVLAFISCGPQKVKSLGSQTPLDLNAIEYIEIRNHSGEVGTLKAVYKRLNAKNQIS